MSDKKAACYFMTRNLYENARAAVNSLLWNGNIDEVFLFIEDDGVGYPVPKNVHCINVSGQKFFDPEGPNFNNHWSYMVMMKTVVCHLLPEYHRALTLDVDTIVYEGVGDLWETDFEGACVMGAREPYKTALYGREYVNAGVLFWDLDAMRAGPVNDVIKAMNERAFSYVEQDCISEVLKWRIKRIPSEYNSCPFTELPNGNVYIHHFAGRGPAAFIEQRDVKLYKDMPWPEAKDGKQGV